MPVSILTDAMCAMWMVSSRRPTHRGVYCTTLVGVISTCVGNRRLPELTRLARKTSPVANGRPLLHTHEEQDAERWRPRRRAPTRARSVGDAPSSPVMIPDVKLFPHIAIEGAPIAVSCSRLARALSSEVAFRQADHLLPSEGQPGDHASDRRRIPGVQRRPAVRGLPDFRGKMLAPENDTTIGLTVAGAMTPAGVGGCVIEMMDRGLVDFIISHRRQPLSRSALRAEFHAAPRLAVRGRRGAVRGRRDPDLRRPLSGDGAARNRRLHP